MPRRTPATNSLRHATRRGKSPAGSTSEDRPGQFFSPPVRAMIVLVMRVRSTAAAILIVSAGLFLAAAPVLAHHSFAAEYDGTKPIKVTGTVTKFDMTNPHSWV